MPSPLHIQQSLAGGFWGGGGGGALGAVGCFNGNYSECAYNVEETTLEE